MDLSNIWSCCLPGPRVLHVQSEEPGPPDGEGGERDSAPNDQSRGSRRLPESGSGRASGRPFLANEEQEGNGNSGNVIIAPHNTTPSRRQSLATYLTPTTSSERRNAVETRLVKVFEILNELEAKFSPDSPPITNREEVGADSMKSMLYILKLLPSNRVRAMVIADLINYKPAPCLPHHLKHLVSILGQEEKKQLFEVVEHIPPGLLGDEEDAQRIRVLVNIFSDSNDSIEMEREDMKKRYTAKTVDMVSATTEELRALFNESVFLDCLHQFSLTAENSSSSSSSSSSSLQIPTLASSTPTSLAVLPTLSSHNSSSSFTHASVSSPVVSFDPSHSHSSSSSSSSSSASSSASSSLAPSVLSSSSFSALATSSANPGIVVSGSGKKSPGTSSTLIRKAKGSRLFNPKGSVGENSTLSATIIQTSRKTRAEIMATMDLWGDQDFEDDTEEALIGPSQGWNIEPSVPHVTMASSIRLEWSDETDEAHYIRLMNVPHNHYVSCDPENPMIISMQKKSDNDSNLLLSVVRVPMGFKKVMVRFSPKEKKLLRRAGALENIKYKMIKRSMFQQASDGLRKLEERDIRFRTHLTVGILYRKKDQTSDDEMYQNEGPIPEFEQFLDCIGGRVKLMGFDNFRGGLDVKSGSTGEESLFSLYQNKYKIMFHVSTMLPFTPNDPQQVSRKRHIGNDLVVIIFQEKGSKRFDPSWIVSNMNHTYIVVRPVDRPPNYSELIPPRLNTNLEPGPSPANSESSNLDMKSEKNSTSLTSVTPSSSYSSFSSTSSGGSSCGINPSLNRSTSSSGNQRIAFEDEEDDVYYEVGVVSKVGVPPFGPYLHNPAVFRKDQYFRHYFLTKIVSAFRATIEAPAFDQRLSKAQTELLKIFINEINPS